MKSLLGTVQILTVERIIETGYVLTDGDHEILLHQNETHGQLKEQQQIDVFLYEDKKGQVVATMDIPTVLFDHYDWVPVVEVVPKLGVFVNIGISKEILVSSDDLPLFHKVWPAKDDRLYVKLDTDKRGRLIAKPADESIINIIREDAPGSILNQPISGYVYHTSREGTAIFSEEGYRGFIHHSERKEEPRLGQWVKGRVIAVKDDGTLNISLRPLKQDSISQDAETILDHLTREGGVIPFSDKSSPEVIKDTFQISKAAFKRALGKLMKEGKIEQKDGKTYLKG